MRKVKSKETVQAIEVQFHLQIRTENFYTIRVNSYRIKQSKRAQSQWELPKDNILQKQANFHYTRKQLEVYKQKVK